MTLVLASQSAARMAMLDAAGVAFSTRPARIDETAVLEAMRGQPVRDAADRLAEMKALKVSLLDREPLVLGADSILETDPGVWLEKPGTIAGLRDQLLALRGRRHQIVSAAVVARNGQILWRHCERATLQVRPFSDSWLAAYIDACGAAMLSSVGGYHLEGLGVQLFEKIAGDQFTIRGLPLLALLAWLREIGELPA